MPCPNCGSAGYRLVSPGVAECTGAVMVPTGAHPSGAMGPTHMPAPCGQRYQVANSDPSVPYCACGMQSVAKCIDCGVPLCLDHAGRVSEGVVCGAHFQARQARAQAAHANAFDAAVVRLTDDLRRFPAEIGSFARELRIEHNIDAEAARGLSQGSPCPTHGARCRVSQIHATGKWMKKVAGATMEIDAWVLRHRCYVHSDIHSGGGRSVSNGVEITAITAAGDVERVTTYSLPIDGRAIRSRGAGIPHDHPGIRTVFDGEARLAGLSLPAFLDELSDGIESVLAGVGKRGALPCRPGV